VGLRGRLRMLERKAQGGTVTLRCRECGDELTVAEDTDLSYLAWEWAQETGAKSYRPTPLDVFVSANHSHGLGSLEVKAIGKPWPLMETEGGMIGLTG
jgi:hypothetical protein